MARYQPPVPNDLWLKSGLKFTTIECMVKLLFKKFHNSENVCICEFRFQLSNQNKCRSNKTTLRIISTNRVGCFINLKYCPLYPVQHSLPGYRLSLGSFIRSKFIFKLVEFRVVEFMSYILIVKRP